MEKNNQSTLTDRNLDQLAEFLIRELDQPTLAGQIPTGAHLFHGSYNDTKLTQANLKLASNILLGMTLGYVEDAPLKMVFEYKSGRQSIMDLSSQWQKKNAQHLISMFQRQSQQEIAVQINELLAA